MNKPDLNKTQALGLVLIFTAITAWMIPASWLMAWTPETTFMESYRGYDIYYIAEANVYAIDTGGEVGSWNYQGSVQGAKYRIDFWLDGPIFVEVYRDFEVYKLNGVEFYYGEGLNDKTNTYDNLDNLKHFIDVEYYGIEVYHVEYQGESWAIMQLGYFEPVFYGVNGELITPKFSTESEAYQYLYDMLTEDAEETDPPLEEEAGEDPTSEEENPIPPDTGENEGILETVSDKLEEYRILISGITGSLGAGLFIWGTTKKEEE